MRLPKQIRQERAKVLARIAVNRWLQGMNEGGHSASREDIMECYRIALGHYEQREGLAVQS